MTRSIDLKNSRIAVILFFLINGLVNGNWIARIPDLEVFYNISHIELGSILLTQALGCVVAMPIAGYLNNVWGSRKVTIAASLLFLLLSLTLAVIPQLLVAYVVFFLYGIASGSLDISMNGQAVYVERDWGTSIMSSFHAAYSVGMVIGAGTGAIGTWLSVALSLNILVVAILASVLALWASRHLILDEKFIKEIPESKGITLPTKAILPIAIIAFCGMTGEGSLSDWSALYMKEIAETNSTWAALAFGVFGGSMTIGRLFGDNFTNKFGHKMMLIYESILATIGLSIALLIPTPLCSIIGFFIAGIGLSNIVPIAYSLAGNTPNVSPAVGIAMATTIGYSGFFLGPPIIGFLADLYDLRVALIFTLLLFAIMTTIIWTRKNLS